jgi:hypothetical protein
VGEVEEGAEVCGAGGELRRDGAGGGFGEAEGEDMAEIRGELDSGEDEEAGAPAEGVELRLGPPAIMLGEADAVDAGRAGGVDESVGGELGAGGAGEGVAVEVDEGHELNAWWGLSATQ